MTNGMQQAARHYRRNQLVGMTPMERLLLLYNMAIAAANEGDADRLLRALAVLRASLRFDEHTQVALGLLRLYRYCEHAVRTRGAFDEAVHILDGLRQAWQMAEPRQAAPMADSAHFTLRTPEGRRRMTPVPLETQG